MGESKKIIPTGDYYKILLPLKFIYYAVTIPALIYGVTSWCLFKKFRTYRNYACLNLLLAQLSFIIFVDMHHIATSTGFITEDNFLIWSQIFEASKYFLSARGHWLVIICHMFYVDIVKVFNGHVRRRYLKSFLFGWVTPLVTTPIMFFSSRNIKLVILMLPLILNIILFIIILCSLCRNSDASAINKCRRFYMATVIFLLGDISFVASFAVAFMKARFSTAIVHVFLFLINPIVLSIFLVVVKSNRELWYEFYVTKFRQRSPARHVDQENNMHEMVIRESANNESQVLED